VKIDLEKAYDRVSWDFMRIVLLQINVPLEVTDWIMACVTSTTFSLLINGSSSNFLRIPRVLDMVFPCLCFSLCW